MTILFLHNRYRTTGGEERAVEDLVALARDELGHDVELLERDSATLGRARAAQALIGGGLDADDVTRAVKRTNATIVHAHNLLPSLGWRALAAAREAGAKTVLHLHNYRLVCAVATCFQPHEQSDCTRCHGRDTRPGVRLACRGSRAEAATYALGLARQQAKLLEHADAIVVPSDAAKQRLLRLGAPVERAHVVGHVVHRFAEAPVSGGTGAFIASRLAPEKGLDVAIDACRQAQIPLTIAGDGPLREQLERQGHVQLLGRIDQEELAARRAHAGVELVPSRAHETFGLAAIEAMAAGLPVVASASGALEDLARGVTLVPPGDPRALAQAATKVIGSEAEGARALRAAREIAAPGQVAPRLDAVYRTLL